MWETDQFNGGFEYSTDLFTKSTINELCQHLEILILELVEPSSNKIQDIQLVSESDINLIEVNNNTENINLLDRTLIKEFKNCLHHFPQNIAISFEDSTITYEELNRRTDITAKKKTNGVILLSLQKSLIN